MADQKEDINFINCKNIEYELADNKVRDRVTMIETLLRDKNIAIINTMAFESKNDYISKEEFQNDVDIIYNACRAKGITPSNNTFRDVMLAIVDNI